MTMVTSRHLKIRIGDCGVQIADRGKRHCPRQQEFGKHPTLSGEMQLNKELILFDGGRRIF